MLHKKFINSPNHEYYICCRTTIHVIALMLSRELWILLVSPRPRRQCLKSFTTSAVSSNQLGSSLSPTESFAVKFVAMQTNIPRIVRLVISFEISSHQ